LTLNEFLKFKNVDFSEDIFNEYIKFWWLPAITFIDDESIKFEYLRWVYNTIFVKDLLEYENIRNPSLLKNLHKFLFSQIWCLVNWKNIVSYLKSQGIKTSVETILNYIEFSLNAFLFDEVLRYDIRWKKIFETTKKYYSFDLWVRNAVVWIDLKRDIWGIYENLVYNYLKFKGYNVYVGVLYDKEIDFVVEKNWEKMYIQVAYLLADEKVIEREFGNLLKIKDWWRKIVISGDKFPVRKYEWIEHINIVDFLRGLVI
jgi:predicted AAA+ superfamily ATPase